MTEIEWALRALAALSFAAAMAVAVMDYRTAVLR
jgi:hypothetical protein